MFPLHAAFSGLVHAGHSLLDIPLAPCEAAAYLIPPAAEKIHRLSCFACAAVNYLSVLPLAGKKRHLSSVPTPLGKTSINTGLFFPLGSCPFWCLLLSLIGSYSSKSCQGSLEFFLSCTLSRMPRKSKDTLRKLGKNLQIGLPIQKTPKCKGMHWSFK